MKFKNNLLLIFFCSLICSSCSLFSVKKLADNNNTDLVLTKEKQGVSFNYNFLEASKQKMLGNFNTAITLYEKTIKIKPESAVCYYELAKIYALQEEFEIGILLAQKSVELNDNNIWYHLLLTELYRQNNQQEKSIQVIENLTKKFPDNLDLYYDLAILLSENNQITEAIEIYQKIEDKIGVTKQVSLNKERIYLFNKDFENAIKELEKLIEKYPNEIEFYGMLADLYLSQENFEKALEIYEKLLSIDKNNGLVHLSLSEFYRLQKQYEKSIKELKIAFANQNVNIEMKINILASFLAYTEEKNVEIEIENLLLILIETHPKNSKVRLIYAEYLSKMNRINDAINQLEITLKYTKNEYPIWEGFLNLLNKKESYKKMLKYADESLSYFPNQANLYLFKGFAENRLGKNKSAIETFENGLNILIDEDYLFIQFYTYLGDNYNKIKEYKNSDKSYEKVLEIDPENAYALNNYSYFLSIRGDSLEKAEEMIKRCLENSPKSVSYLDTYAWILYKSNKFIVAEETIIKAIKYGGNKRTTILEHYGDILFKLNKKTEAKEQWEKAFEMGDGSEFLKEKATKGQLIE